MNGGERRRAIETAASGFGIHRCGASIEMKREIREALLLSWNAGLLLVGGMILSATVEDSSASALLDATAERRADSSTRR
jgi:hypothetical protein